MSPTKKIKCDVTNNTNKYCSYQSFFSFFFGMKNHQMMTLFQISGKKSPFYQKELPKLPPILGSL
jgi:hypothetical protein